MAAGDAPVLPDYGGACVSNVVPALTEWPERPAWLPPEALAEQIVLLVLDGLGWDQLVERASLAPTMSALAGGPITTIAPSTTAAALTSITTGLPPGEHGVVGYRMWVAEEVLNVLRWSTPRGDARTSQPAADIQTEPVFGGQRPPVVTRAEFASSGFTQAHLRGARFVGYRVTSTFVTSVTELVEAGEPFVYAYYDGVDKVAHEYGLRRHYDAEVGFADRLVTELLDVLPSGTALVVTADHGQVEAADLEDLHPDVLGNLSAQSGEARFRWLHARPGRTAALFDAAASHHGERAWVRTREEIISEGWLGPKVTDEAAARLGDVALVASRTAGFNDPADTGPFRLIGRHGSLTRAEMLVPLVAAIT